MNKNEMDLDEKGLYAALLMEEESKIRIAKRDLAASEKSMGGSISRMKREEQACLEEHAALLGMPTLQLKIDKSVSFKETLERWIDSMRIERDLINKIKHANEEIKKSSDQLTMLENDLRENICDSDVAEVIEIWKGLRKAWEKKYGFYEEITNENS